MKGRIDGDASRNVKKCPSAPKGGMQSSEFAIGRTHDVGHETIADQITVLSHGRVHIGEDHPAGSEGLFNLVDDGDAVHLEQ
jgi:hypothetical protein